MLRAAVTLVLVASAGGVQAAGGLEPRPAGDACLRAEEAHKQHRDPAALEAAAECERRARLTGAHDLLARALLVRGNVEYRRSAFLDGLSTLKQAMREAESAGDRALRSSVYARLSDVSNQLGDWPGMMDYARRAFEADPSPDDRARIRFLTARGRAYGEIHERDKGLDDLEQALELARRIKDEDTAARLKNLLGFASWRFDRDRTKALAHYEEGLAMARRVNNQDTVVNILNNSANVLRSIDAWTEAEQRYAEAIEIGRRTGVPSPFALKNQGIVFRETGRRRQAEKILLEAVALADRQGVGRIRWQARKELGVLFRESDPARASRYFEECLETLEALNSNVLLEGFSAGALAGALAIQDDPYDLYIDLLLRQQQPAKALFVAERARARAFLDTLATAREAIAAALPPQYVASERELLKRISDDQSQLRKGDLDAARETEIRNVVRQDEERLTSLRVSLATEHPEIAHARYPRLVGVAEMQALLGPEDALLEYFLGAEASTLWIVKPNGLTVARLAGKPELERAVRRYLEVLSTPAGAFQEPGRALARLLLPTGQALAGVRRLVIIPHGALHHLPFETLAGPEGRFVVESQVVAYAPSASSLAYLRSRPAAPEGEVVAIGNPRLGGAGAGTERGAGVERVDLLKPLPHTGREVRAVAASFPWITRVLEQDQATEPALAEAGLEHAAILHFATHGMIDEEVPERSGLALTAAPQSDGILQTREIYRLRLRAALVTLSACQTALGKEITGEGILGLSRAFLHAGARAVMASLWNVNDASTAQFMERFYAAVRRGEPADAAARSAKLGFIGDARLKHPYFWGAFVVNGDAGSPVRLVRAPSRLSPLLAGGLLAAIPGGLLLRVLLRGAKAGVR